MENYYLVVFFILGSIMGSFYYVVGSRVPNKESIISPPSHCPGCKTRLKWYELIPLISYIIQFGKCRTCKARIPVKYFIIESVTAILFATAYHVWKLTPELAINLVFISALIIIIISDIEYMIILDEVIYIASILILVLNIFFNGFDVALNSLLQGIYSFITMYAVKIIGDFLFKKESLGGGDIKLMFLFGIALGYEVSILSIFAGTFIAFPISIVILIMNKDHMIPFGPFLSIGALLLLISGLNLDKIIEFIPK